jgi:cytochrome c oxidase subunit IV
VDGRVNSPPPHPAQGSSCWLRGCLLLAMVIPALLLIVLVMMVMSRLASHA